MEVVVRDSKKLAHTLMRFRKERGLSQGQVAAASGLRQSTVSTAESSGVEIKAGTLFGLLSVLDLEIVIRPRTQSSVEIKDIF